MSLVTVTDHELGEKHIWPQCDLSEGAAVAGLDALTGRLVEGVLPAPSNTRDSGRDWSRVADRTAASVPIPSRDRSARMQPSSPTHRQTISAILIDAGAVTSEQVDLAIERHREPAADLRATRRRCAGRGRCRPTPSGYRPARRRQQGRRRRRARANGRNGNAAGKRS